MFSIFAACFHVKPMKTAGREFAKTLNLGETNQSSCET